MAETKFLIFGNSWVSGLVQESLQENGDNYIVSSIRIEDREAVLREIDSIEPTHIINTAGARGSPNYWGSFYSQLKLICENVLKTYSNILILRIRNPLAADLHPKNFVAKLLGYRKISGLIMTNLVPGVIFLAKHKETGIYNFTNPGTFTHNEVMGLMKEYIRSSLTWINFSLEEQRAVLEASRCNAKLDATKLINRLGEYGYTVLNSHDAFVEAFVEMKTKRLQ